MIVHLVLISLATFLPFSYAQSLRKPDEQSNDTREQTSKLFAIVRPDNDIDTEEKPQGELVPVPLHIEGVIDNLVDEYFNRLKPHLDVSEQASFSIELLYGPIFKIKAPHNKDLFVFLLNFQYGCASFYFIMYDEHDYKATSHPPSFSCRWMNSGDLEKPIISFQDFDMDGTQELVAQEIAHNGTLYNAVVYHYYKVMPDLSLKHILALETQLVDIFTDGTIIRSIKMLDHHTLRMNVDLEFPQDQTKRKSLGYVILERANPDTAFQIKERHSLNEKYSGVLITACESEDNDENWFLSEGCISKK